MTDKEIAEGAIIMAVIGWAIALILLIPLWVGSGEIVWVSEYTFSNQAMNIKAFEHEGVKYRCERTPDDNVHD